MSSQTTRWVGVVALLAVGAIGAILWTVTQKRPPPPPPRDDRLLDSLVMGVIEKAVLRDAQRTVAGRCVEFLEQPVSVELRLECETVETGVKVNRAEVLGGEDGGVVAGDVSACITASLIGLENHTTHVRDPQSDAGVPLKLPVGRAYELDLGLTFSRVVADGYIQ